MPARFLNGGRESKITMLKSEMIKRLQEIDIECDMLVGVTVNGESHLHYVDSIPTPHPDAAIVIEISERI